MKEKICRGFVKTVKTDKTVKIRCKRKIKNGKYCFQHEPKKREREIEKDKEIK